jgi:hypothetical protein
MNQDTELELFTPQDAARVCGCCAATVKRLAAVRSAEDVEKP